MKQISANLQKNVFKCPWVAIIMTNSDDNGELLKFNILKDYKKQVRSGSIVLVVPEANSV